MTICNNKDLKIYLIAGEPSGDLLGSRLMRALKQKLGKKVRFFGLGSDTMEAEGLKSLFDISELSIMGLTEVIPSIPRVLRRIKETVADIKRVRPDIVVTIDSWSFSSRVHKALRREKLDIPQVHYVAPQVWAWKKKRARTMYKYIDRLLTLLPQEPKYFTPYHLQADFVGHPVIESEVVHGDAKAFRKKYHIAEDQVIVSILPGSRKTEVSKLLPVFLEAAAALHRENNRLCFVIPTVKTVSDLVKKAVSDSDLPLLVVESQQDRYNAFNASAAAIAASGTVALELAICNVPHLIAYKVSPLSALLVRHFLKIQFVNLSNILLGREVVPELLQERCVAGNLCHYTREFLHQGPLYDKQQAAFGKIREILGHGEQTPSENAADILLDMIKNKQNQRDKNK